VADGSHRLAVNQAMGRAESGEGDRRDAMSPLEEFGGDPGVTLSEASAGDLASLGMSPDVVIPEIGPLVQPGDYRS
jgi:hypothetical protein